LEADGVSIADEDVEAFIADSAKTCLREIRQAVCAHLSTTHLSDSYAATHYADALAACDRAAEILPLIEKDPIPSAISDPIALRAVQLRRLRLALKACQSAGNPTDSLKVILLAAEATQGEAALIALLEKEADLAVNFARESVARLVLSDPDSAPKQGAILAQEAAKAARERNRVNAREQLRFHNVWLGRRREIAKGERHLWEIEDADILARAETTLFLGGAEAALRELTSWRPRHTALTVGRKLVHSLIARGEASVVDDVLGRGLFRDPWKLILLVPLALAGKPIAREKFERALSALNRRLTPTLQSIEQHSQGAGWRIDLLDVVLSACEIAFANGVNTSAIRHALGVLIDFSIPMGRRVFHSDAVSIDLLCRAWVLHHAIEGTIGGLDELRSYADPPRIEVPPRRRRTRARHIAPIPTQHKKDEDLSRSLDAVYPVYESRIKALSPGNAATGSARVGDIATITADDYQFDRSYWSRDLRARAARSVILLMHHPQLPTLDLFTKARSQLKEPELDPFASQLLPLYRALLLRVDQHNFILAALTAAESSARQAKAKASDKVDAFISFSRLVGAFSMPDASAFFREAVALAQGIDREALDQIAILSSLTGNFSAWDQDRRTLVAAQVFRFVSDVAIRLGGEDDFPWDETITSLTRLSPMVALASIARWADEGVVGEDDTLGAFTLEVSRRDIAAPEVAAALLFLLPEERIGVTRAVARAALRQDPMRRQRIMNDLASRCLAWSGRAMRMKIAAVLIEESDMAAAQFPRLAELRTMVTFLDRIEEDTPQGEDARIREVSNSDASTAPLDLSGRTFRAVKDIEAVIADTKKLDGFFRLRTVLQKAREAVTSPADRVPFLDALVGVDLDELYESDRAAAILDALSVWTGSPAVENWRRDRLPKVIESLFPALARWFRRGSDTLSEILDAATLDAPSRQRVLLAGIGNLDVSFGSRSIFGVANMVAETLNPIDAWQALAWYVARLEGRIPDTTAGAMNVKDLPASLTAAIGRFLFADLAK
jgi:hypothetical protein